MTDGDRLFEPLAPPPGGAAALRLRLRRDRWRRRGGRAALAGAALALAVAGLLRSTTGRRLTLPPEPHAALIALGLQAPPAEPASVPPGMRYRMALLRVPLDTDRVVFYYVAVLPDEPAGTPANESSGERRSPAGAGAEASTIPDESDPGT